MNFVTPFPGTSPLRKSGYAALAIGSLTALLLAPGEVLEATRFVLVSLIEVAPIVIPGILVAAWISASGASAHVAGIFAGRTATTIAAASAVGAITPVCGVTVLPLMAGLLAAGIPLAPVMAFWLSSPITDPAMLAATAATLGLPFAIGKTVAAFGLGLFGGFATALLSRTNWTEAPLRRNGIAGNLGTGCEAMVGFAPAVWRERDRLNLFVRECWSIGRLILICLVPAFAAEHVLDALLRPEAMSAYVGAESRWAIPLAVLVGAPAYLDGYAALPLTRALMEHGMSPGAAMAFLVSGGVVSIWGAMAILPVLRIKPFSLYLVLAVTGSMLAGWLYGAVA